ncbi:MAG: dihydrodipicolinate synthase family protein [Acidobacteriota bacterium]
MKIRGVLPPVTTPFDNRGEVDTAALRANLRRYLDCAVAGIVVLGTNGEAALLDEAESDAMVAAARESVPSDRVLIAGAARESTRATVAAARRAASLGADAVLVRTPSAYKSQMTAEALVGYYAAVADSSPAPVILYDFTAATGVNLAPGLVERLALHPNVAGIKDSNGDMAQIAELVGLASDRFSVLVGSPQTFYTSLCLGVDGGILAAACFAPRACVAMYELVMNRRHQEALALQRELLPLIRTAFLDFGVPGLKVAVDAAGYAGGPARPPLPTVPPEAATRIRDAVTAFQKSVDRTAPPRMPGS